MSDGPDTSDALIVAIVVKGWGSTALQAAVRAGARGGTVLIGRGAGVNERETLFGMSIEPEKEILLSVVSAGQVDTILEAIVESVGMNEIGRGIAFVLPVDRVVGVVQALKPSTAGG